MLGSTQKLSYSVVLPKNGANPTTSWPITALSRACKPSDKARLYIKRRNKELGDVQVCTMYIVWSDPLQKSKQNSVQSDAYKAETRRHHLITFTTMLLPVLVGWFTSLKAENMNDEKGSKVRRMEVVKKWNEIFQLSYPPPPWGRAPSSLAPQPSGLSSFSPFDNIWIGFHQVWSWTCIGAPEVPHGHLHRVPEILQAVFPQLLHQGENINSKNCIERAQWKWMDDVEHGWVENCFQSHILHSFHLALLVLY